MSGKEYDDINKKLDRILWYIEDDERTGRKGIYHRLYDNENEVKILKSDKRFLLGMSAGLSLVVTALSLFLSYIFNIFKGS